MIKLFTITLVIISCNLLYGINETPSLPPQPPPQGNHETSADLQIFQTELYDLCWEVIYYGMETMPVKKSSASLSTSNLIAFAILDIYRASLIIPECLDFYMPSLKRFAELLKNEKVKAVFEPGIQHKLTAHVEAFSVFEKIMGESYTVPFELPYYFISKYHLNTLVARYIYWDKYNFDRKLDALECIANNDYDNYQKIISHLAVDYFKFAAQLQLVFDPEFKLANATEDNLESLRLIVDISSQNEIMQQEINANQIVKSWLEEWQKKLPQAQK